MRLLIGNIIILLLATAEVRGGPYLKLLQDALRIGERAREGEAFGGIRKDLGETLDGIKKDLETNMDFQLRWLGLRWNDTGEGVDSFVCILRRDAHNFLVWHDDLAHPGPTSFPSSGNNGETGLPAPADRLIFRRIVRRRRLSHSFPHGT